MNYKEQLGDKRWKAKREEILKRDGYECAICHISSVKCSTLGYKTTLQVHHVRYENGKMAWEYENSKLITLCSKCHASIHSNNPFPKKKEKKKKSVRIFFGYNTTK